MKIGVIGGSGIYKMDGVAEVARTKVTTPYGRPSDDVLELAVDGVSFNFLPRHGIGHRFTPSEVNYRANIFALKQIGVTHIVSVSAVGSLQEQFAPGTFVLPDQFIDWTKGLRSRSFFGEGMVGHVSTALPIDLNLQERIYQHCQAEKVTTFKGGSYICIEGPQFSSKAESQIYRSFGASVIGMTNVPEAYLAKEAGMAYATIAMVTDYDCWKEEHCTLEEIMRVMSGNNVAAQKVLKKLIPSLVKNPTIVNAENKNAVVTAPELLSKEHKEILEILLK